MPDLFIISGCNGAGKTTASFTLLPKVLGINEFVNADEIARGLSPFNQDSVAFEAGRIMLSRIKELIDNKKSFAFETTLATRSYVSLVKSAQKKGYEVYLLFFWLNSDKLAIQRVKQRVEKGGHNIESDVIRRRYKAGLSNLKNLYRPIVDAWILYDNSLSDPEKIAFGYKKRGIFVDREDLFKIVFDEA